MEISKEFSNSMWLMGEKILKIIGQIILGVVLARYLIKDEFGILNFFISYVYIFYSLSSFGMENLIVKFIVEKKYNQSSILMTSFIFRIFLSVFLFILALIIGKVILLDGLEEYFYLFLFILLQILLTPFDVFRLYFQSRLKSIYPSIAISIGYLFAIILRIYFAINNQLVLIGFTYALDILIYSIVLLFLYNLKKEEELNFNFDKVFLKELLKSAIPLAISNLFYLIYVKADQLMLGKFSSQSEVAIYSIASRLSEAWYFIPISIVNSVFPSIIRLKHDLKKYKERLSKVLLLLSTISIFIAIITTFISFYFVTLLYGKPYQASAEILDIHIWSGVIVFSGVLSGAWIINEGLEKISMYRTISGAILNITLNYILIVEYGAYGVAISTLITRFCVSYLFNMFNSKTRPIFKLQSKAYLDAIQLKGISLIFDFFRNRKLT